MAVTFERLGDTDTFSRRLGSVSVLFDDRQTFVALAGEVDVALRRELSGHAEDVTSRCAAVRVDVRDVTSIDSIGLGFLARIARAGSAGRFPVLIVGASGRIRASIALAGIDGLVTYQD